MYVPQPLEVGALSHFDLPTVFRCGVELAEAASLFAEKEWADLPADCEGPTSPIFERQMEASRRLQRIEEETQRLKRSLGACGPLEFRGGETDGGPKWESYDQRFNNTRHDRVVRLALLKLATSAIDLSGFATWRERQWHMRETGLRLLAWGLGQLWQGMSEAERSVVRDRLPRTRKAICWPANPATDPPSYDGPEEIPLPDRYRIIGNYISCYRDYLDDVQDDVQKEDSERVKQGQEKFLRRATLAQFVDTAERAGNALQAMAKRQFDTAAEWGDLYTKVFWPLACLRRAHEIQPREVWPAAALEQRKMLADAADILLRCVAGTPEAKAGMKPAEADKAFEQFNEATRQLRNTIDGQQEKRAAGHSPSQAAAPAGVLAVATPAAGGRASPLSRSALQHSRPFTDLVTFAHQCAAEASLQFARSNGRRRPRSELSGQITPQEIKLSELVSACRSAWPRTGYPAPEAERRVNAVDEPTRAILCWELKAPPPAPDQDEDPASAYLFEHRKELEEAIRDVVALADAAGENQREGGEVPARQQKSPRAAILVEAIDELLESFRVYRQLPRPDLQDVDALTELHRKVVRLAAAAGLGAPPEMVEAELRVNNPLMLNWENPNRNAGQEFERKLLSLRAAASAACSKTEIGAPGADGEPPIGRRGQGYVFRQDHEVWEVTFGDEHGKFSPIDGMVYIAHLLGHPDQACSAAELKNLTANAIAPDKVLRQKAQEEGQVSVTRTTDQHAIDQKGIQACEKRLSDIACEREAARRAGDIEKIDDLDEEEAKVKDYLRKGRNIRGDSRLLGDPNRSVFNSVKQAIDRAMKKLAGSPKLHEHLSKAINSGSGSFEYRPVPPPLPWQL